MICETCTQQTLRIAPCPCGLNGECPVHIGVCDACYDVILRNAVERRHEHARHAA